jgi:hypothetical protein
MPPQIRSTRLASHPLRTNRFAPLAWIAGAAGILGPLASAHGGELTLSYETTSGGTQSSGTTSGGDTLSGSTPTVIPIGGDSYFYGESFNAPTPIINAAVNPTAGFYDDFAFTVSAASVESATITLNFGSLQQIQNLSVGLFSVNNYNIFAAGGVPSSAPVPGEIFATMSGSELVLTDPDLSAGTYVLEVVGQATGTEGGSYAGVLDVSPVPLPPALPMVLGGLAVLAGAAVSRRRAG